MGGIYRTLLRASRRAAQALVAQECINARFAAAEGPKAVERAAAAARLEHVLAQTPAGLDAEHPAVFGRCLLKRTPGVGRQHLGPLVAVVARGVAAVEDVRKRV